MDLTKVLFQLRAELENIDSAIASLERLQESNRRRGKEPEVPVEETPKKLPRSPRRGRPPSNPESSSS